MEIEQAAATVTQVVYLSEDQFSVLTAKADYIGTNQIYIVILICVLIGIGVINAFWNGWKAGD